MRRPKTTGRSRLLGDGGRPLTDDDEDPQPKAPEAPQPQHVPRLRPQPAKRGVPLAYGRMSAEELARLDKEGQRRRAGGDVPGRNEERWGKG